MYPVLVGSGLHLEGCVCRGYGWVCVCVCVHVYARRGHPGQGGFSLALQGSLADPLLHPDLLNPEM